MISVDGCVDRLKDGDKTWLERSAPVRSSSFVPSESEAQSQGERSVSRQPEPERYRQLRKREREETFFRDTLLLVVDSKKRANDRWLVSLLVFLPPNFCGSKYCASIDSPTASGASGYFSSLT
jgi:hypothetical protein